MKALTVILFLLGMALTALATFPPDTSDLPSLAIDETTHNDLPLPLIRAAIDAFPVGTACTNEGDWNCLTTAYQRCAEGVWTLAQPLAAGIECSPVGFSHNSSSEGPPVFSIGPIGGGSAPTPSATESGSAPSESLFTSTITTTYTTTQTSSTGPSSSVSVVTTTVTTIVMVTVTPDASANASKSAAASTSGVGAPKADESGAGHVWEGATWAVLEFLMLVAAWL